MPSLVHARCAAGRRPKGSTIFTSSPFTSTRTRLAGNHSLVTQFPYTACAGAQRQCRHQEQLTLLHGETYSGTWSTQHFLANCEDPSLPGKHKPVWALATDALPIYRDKNLAQRYQARSRQARQLERKPCAPTSVEDGALDAPCGLWGALLSWNQGLEA
eukprot:scaffold65625_cov16-Tisochrysis_lutea.AAC.1